MRSPDDVILHSKVQRKVKIKRKKKTESLGFGIASKSIYCPLATDDLLENTDGIRRPRQCVFPRGGSLLPSISADVRAILMTSSHSEGTGRSFAPR